MSGDNGQGPAGLRAVLADAIAEEGGTLDALTVLAAQNDPYRADTPGPREAGEWFAAHVERINRPRLHFRGYHYALLGEPKPNGKPYRNTDADWRWLQDVAGDAARWLGLIAFDRIADERNQAPVVRTATLVGAEPYISVGEVELEIPEELDPRVDLYAAGSSGAGEERFAVQPHRLAVFGEKVSLDAVVGPIAERYGASVYLPTGESSDTMVYEMMRAAAEDGRRLVVLYLSDCDPAGWQMAISVARKMQAFRDLLFGGVEFELHPIALTPDQVCEYGLPSSPMKPSERRADKWFAAHGVHQTEIDALATLRPEVLADILTEALDAYTDHTLEDRVQEAYELWTIEAQAALEEQLDAEELDRIRADAEDKLAELEEQVAAINDGLRVDVAGIVLPEFQAPEPEDRLYGLPYPLIDSGWGYAEASRRLKAHKAYEGER